MCFGGKEAYGDSKGEETRKFDKQYADDLVKLARQNGFRLNPDDAYELINQSYNPTESLEDFYKGLEFDKEYDPKLAADELIKLAKEDGKTLTTQEASQIIEESYNEKASSLKDFYNNLSWDDEESNNEDLDLEEEDWFTKKYGKGNAEFSEDLKKFIKELYKGK